MFLNKSLTECSVRNQVDSFVLISTDKAVRPTSMMGVSKRLAELCCLYMNTLASTKFITVDFGNVRILRVALYHYLKSRLIKVVQ